MSLFAHIFVTTMIPIFLIVGIGLVLDRSFKLDLRTMSKFNFYILLPCFMFKTLYTAHLNHESIEVILCALCILFGNRLIAQVSGRIAGYDQRKIQILKNATMFNNGGNIGVAVATFVYTNIPYLVGDKAPYLETGLVAIIATLVVQNITCNTVGFYQAGIGVLTKRDALRVVLRMPTAYAVPAAILAKFFLPYDLTTSFAWPVVVIIAGAFVPIAMMTLGIQINRSSWNFFHKDVMNATFLRLIAGPIIAAGIVLAFTVWYAPFTPISAHSIIITYSVPSALNTALIAFEMKNNPEFATQVVMSTTIFSAITMPIAIIFAYYLFPLG